MILDQVVIMQASSFKRSAFLISFIGGLLRAVEAGETSLQLLSPESLRREDGYDHQSAEYGFVQCPYSSATKRCTLQGQLHYIDSSFCNESEIDRYRGGLPSSPIFLMIHRGDEADCSFAAQIQNVQSMSGENIAGVVFADHTCLCRHANELCEATRDNPLCVEDPPALLSQENSAGIYLPSILLEKQHADLFIQESESSINEGAPILMELAWESPIVASHEVRMEYWQPQFMIGRDGDDEALEVSSSLSLSTLRNIVDQLEPYIQFTPFYDIQSGMDLGCYPNENADMCSEHCTNNGLYCAFPNDGNTGLLRGKDLIAEYLYRMCIWDNANHTTSARNNNHQWWNYVTEFEKNCTTSEDVSAMSACGRQVMVATGGESQTISPVSRCVITSGGLLQDKENTLLQSNLDALRGSIIRSPALVVNGMQYRADTLEESLGAICAGYTSNTKPNICRQCVNCLVTEDCIVDEANSCMNRVPTPAPIVSSDEQGTTNPADAATDFSGTNEDGVAENDDNTTKEEGEESTAEKNNGRNATSDINDSNSKESESGGGLSDTTKIVIVVGVVGGAIVIIFAFVTVLVWRLFTRIRKLEKKDKHTPSTTSPAGSGVWNLPMYVTSQEDPFNNDGIEDIAMEMKDKETYNARVEMALINSGTVEPVPNQGMEKVPSSATPAVSVAAATEVTPGEEFCGDGTCNNGIHQTRNSDTLSVAENESNRSSQPRRTRAPTDDTSTSLVDMASLSAAETGSKSPKRTVHSDEAADAASSKSPKVINDKKSSPIRGNKLYAQIMGKAAPEARIPRSFSFENEEKEEISEDARGYR